MRAHLRKEEYYKEFDIFEREAVILSTANFWHQCDQQLNLSQVSNKAASSVDKEKLLKK